MRNILICPIAAIKNEIAGSDAYYILNTSTADDYEAGQNAVVLHYLDTEDSCNPLSFSDENANRIIHFFYNLPESADLFVCCDSGESRSPAIAAALLRAQGESDAIIWNSAEYHPNALVFRRMCENLGIQIREETILHLAETNRKAFQKAVQGGHK